MPHSERKPSARLDPRKPLVFNTKALGQGPGSERSQSLTVPAPAHVQAGLVGVPEGTDIPLDVRMEAVTEGVLVTATAKAMATGECARCLDPLQQSIDVRLQELFAYTPETGDGESEGYSLDGYLLDLEPALHDALVLALPLAPLCTDDCPGLCVECGVQLAQAGPDHRHGPAVDPRWAALEELVVPEEESPAHWTGQRSNGNGVRERPAGGGPGSARADS